MKAYITCPVSHSDNRLHILPVVKSICDELDIKSFVFGIGGTAKEIFKKDYEEIKSSDIIIAEVSETSHGVGIEIGMSYCLGLKRILIMEKGKFVTKMATGMPDTYIIEYSSVDDLKNKVKTQLKKMVIDFSK